MIDKSDIDVKVNLALSISIAIYNTGFITFFVGKLFVTQMWLASIEMTSYEYYKNQWKVKPNNPYNKYVVYNPSIEGQS